MEISDSPMTERQRSYRETYRSRIVGWYNGWLHVATIYAIGFTSLAIYIQSMNDIRWWEWLIVPKKPGFTCDLSAPYTDASSIFY